eukprot:3028234-Lingulodinium_polyedra.AAC.1
MRRLRPFWPHPPPPFLRARCARQPNGVARPGLVPCTLAVERRGTRTVRWPQRHPALRFGPPRRGQGSVSRWP